MSKHAHLCDISEKRIQRVLTATGADRSLLMLLTIRSGRGFEELEIASVDGFAHIPSGSP
jgi:hypothetical protein